MTIKMPQSAADQRGTEMSPIVKYKNVCQNDPLRRNDAFPEKGSIVYTAQGVEMKSGTEHQISLDDAAPRGNAHSGEKGIGQTK